MTYPLIYRKTIRPRDKEEDEADRHLDAEDEKKEWSIGSMSSSPRCEERFHKSQPRSRLHNHGHHAHGEGTENRAQRNNSLQFMLF